MPKYWDENTGEWALSEWVDPTTYGGGTYSSPEAVIQQALTPNTTLIDPETGATQPMSVPVPGPSPVGYVAPIVGVPMTSPVFTSAVADDGGYGAFEAWIGDQYGTLDIGQVRFSSEALENGQSGVRFGTMDRIVLKDFLEGGDW